MSKEERLFHDLGNSNKFIDVDNANSPDSLFSYPGILERASASRFRRLTGNQNWIESY